MSVKGTKRKTAAEFVEEHKLFLQLIKERRPELEIMQDLDLTKIQLNAHVLQALKKNEVSNADLNPEYEVVYVRSLPEVIRERLSPGSQCDAATLAKVAPREDGVFLTLLTVPHGNQAS